MSNGDGDTVVIESSSGPKRVEFSMGEIKFVLCFCEQKDGGILVKYPKPGQSCEDCCSDNNNKGLRVP